MKAVIIAAGYATRLVSVTNNGEIAKTLLPIEVAGKQKPILHFLLEKIEKLETLDEIIVVTNNKYKTQIKQSIKQYAPRVPVSIYSDGTVEAPAKGANVAIYIANQHIPQDYNDDILVLGSDNYFEFELTDMYYQFQQQKADYGDEVNMVACKTYPDKDREFIAKNFGILEVGKNNLIYALAEKPGIENLPSNNVSLALYLFNSSDFNLINYYMQNAQGKARDSLGYFINFIIENSVSFAYPITGKFLDIGTPEEYYQIAGNTTKNL